MAMYSVYAMNPTGNRTIYNDSWLLVGEYGHSVAMFDPVLTLEDNSAGSFTFTLPKENQGYDVIEQLSTEIRICEVRFDNNKKAKTEDEIWRGRVIGMTEDFIHNRQYTCEGELNYLRDTRQPQKRYDRFGVKPKDYIKALLDIHNAKAGTKKQFKMGECEFLDWEKTDVDTYGEENTTGYEEDDKYRITQYEETLECISACFEDLKNPHIEITRKVENGKTVRYFNIRKEKEDNGTWGAVPVMNQEVRLGVNLLDFAKNFDVSDLASVIIPLGAQKEGNKANIGDPWILSPDPTKQPVYETTLSDENGRLIARPGDQNFKVIGSYSVKADEKYFYTCRNVNGYGMYAFTSDPEGQKVIEWKASDPGDEETGEGKITEVVDELITVPKGATHLFIAGWGDYPLRLNRYIDDAEAEQYVTVSQVVDKKRKKNKGSVCVISEELTKKYGWIEKVVEFPTITNPQILYDRTLKYFKEDMFENIIFEVKVVDMSSLDKNAESFKIGRYVPVVSGPHDLDMPFPISKLEIHLGQPDQSLVTLGKAKKRTMTNIQSSSSAAITKSIADTTRVTSNKVNEAFERSAELIKNGMYGHVTLVRDPKNTDIIREIVISQQEDYTRTAQDDGKESGVDGYGVWRWNANGLGYSPNGYDEFSPNVAITMDGHINADYIAARSIDADRIGAGILKVGQDGMVSSRIEAYSLQPQGNDYVPLLNSRINEVGISQFSYREDRGEYPSVGISDGEIRGYLRGRMDPYGATLTRIGLLDLAHKDQLGDQYYNDILLQAVTGWVFIRSYFGQKFRCDGQDTFEFRIAGTKVFEITLDGLWANSEKGFLHGATGGFSTSDGKRVYVKGGIITKIE